MSLPDRLQFAFLIGGVLGGFAVVYSLPLTYEQGWRNVAKGACVMMGGLGLFAFFMTYLPGFGPH